MSFLDVVVAPEPLRDPSAAMQVTAGALAKGGIADDILLALLLTAALEVIAAWVLGVRDKWELCLVALINCVTNPAVNAALLVFSWLIPDAGAAWWIVVAVLETVAVVSEWEFYCRCLNRSIRKALLLSLILNALSFSLGLLIL